MKQESKEVLLEQLKKTPIIQVACEKVGVARATFYRWRKDDSAFAEQVDEALCSGSELINDMAESVLISAIKNGNITAIIFWLKNHHKAYAQKLEVTTKSADIPLTDEQKEMIRKSLTMAFATKLTESSDEQNTETA